MLKAESNEQLNLNDKTLKCNSKLYIICEHIQFLHKYSRRVFSVVSPSVNNNGGDETWDVFPYGRIIRLCAIQPFNHCFRRDLSTDYI